MKKSQVLLLGSLLLTFVLVLGLRQSVGAGAAADSSAAEFEFQAPPDNGLGVNFLTGPNTGAALDIARAYVAYSAASYGLSEADLADVVLTDMYDTEHNQTTHVYLRQRYAGLEVVSAWLNINISADGSVINMSNSFVTDLAGKTNTTEPALSATAAAAAAAAHLNLDATDFQVLGAADGADQGQMLSDGGVSQDAIPARLMYWAAETDVRLVWDLVIYPWSSDHWWNLQVDAVTGAVLNQFDWVVNENVSGGEGQAANVQPVSTDGSATTSIAAEDAGLASSPSALLGSSDQYRVFPIPFEHPLDGSGHVIVTDPADLTASPFGWHDDNGAVGGEYTDTRGNNVWAQDDIDANNSGGFRPPGVGSSPGILFDYAWNPAQEPADGTNLEAAIVNLFYWNNIMHDMFYLYGFDEAAGNFQENNYGNGGAGSDPVNADAQDGSGTNNANFGTPGDGANPRMQMYIWTNPFSQLVTVNSPAGIADDYVANPSNSGGLANGLAADLALVDDGVAPTTDACQSVNNDLTGKIALIVWSEGLCNSSVFVANAAAAGAVAAIIIDNSELPYTNFGGSAAIPSVAIGSTAGQLFLDTIIINALTINATIDDNPATLPDRDSDLDNGIIAHEYGHGISNRLTGGPNNVSCLGNTEQMGEGWSDLLALFTTAKVGDAGSDARGIGTYAVFQDPTGEGIRLFPYSTDLAVNPQTYANVGDTNVSVPHGVGAIWAAMVWEVYWNMVDAYGFDPDLYNGTGGNNLAIQLVIDGMKLQTCGPDFVDGRDAILLADLNNNGGANACHIWEGFAKRGLGVSADAGSPNSVTDGTPAFDVPISCSASNRTYLPTILRP